MDGIFIDGNMEQGLNPFLNQVFPYQELMQAGIDTGSICLNPFLNQVFPYFN